MSDGGTEPAASGGRAPPRNPRPDLPQLEGSDGEFDDSEEYDFTHGGDRAASVMGPEFLLMGGTGGDYYDDSQDYTNRDSSRSFTAMGQRSGPQQVHDVPEHIHVWNNGFTIGDDGPLRDNADPQYADMAERIRKGKIKGTITTHNQDYRGVGSLYDHSSTVAQPTQDLNTVNRSLEERSLTLSQPTQEANTINSLQERSLQLAEPTQEANSFSRSIKERTFIFLLGKKKWDTAESSLCNILGGRKHWKNHPVIFLHLRRRALMDLIDEENWTRALDYFERHIRIPFNEIVQDEAALRNADGGYIKAEIKGFKLCVDKHERDYKQVDDDEKLTDFIFDYIRLHVPDKLGFKIQKGFWRFAIEIPKKYPNSRKKSFRCLACSNHDMHSESIGKLHNHLRRCRMMISPFLKDLLKSIEGTASKASEGLAADSKSSRRGPDPPPPPTRHEYHQMFLNELAKARADLLIARESIPVADRASLDPLDQSFDNMEFYATNAWSASGPVFMPRTSSPKATAHTSSSTVVRRPDQEPASAPPSGSVSMPRTSSSLEVPAHKSSSSDVHRPHQVPASAAPPGSESLSRTRSPSKAATHSSSSSVVHRPHQAPASAASPTAAFILPSCPFEASTSTGFINYRGAIHFTKLCRICSESSGP